MSRIRQYVIYGLVIQSGPSSPRRAHPYKSVFAKETQGARTIEDSMHTGLRELACRRHDAQRVSGGLRRWAHGLMHFGELVEFGKTEQIF